jgi:hypothetical protein
VGWVRQWREEERDAVVRAVGVRGEERGGVTAIVEQGLLESLQQRKLMRLGGEVLGLEGGEAASEERFPLRCQEADAGPQGERGHE